MYKINSNNKFVCPECGSKNLKSRMKIYNIPTTGLYSKVNEEIQCGECFMDIPAQLTTKSNKTIYGG